MSNNINYMSSHFIDINQSIKYAVTKEVNMLLRVIICIGKCTSRKSRGIWKRERGP